MTNLTLAGRIDDDLLPFPVSATPGWGIGFAIHAAVVFLGGGRIGSDWEERKIREYVDRER